MGLLSAQFLEINAWILRRLWAVARLHLVLAVALGGMGLVLTLGSLALLLDFVGHMQTGESVPVSIRGMVLIPNAGFALSLSIIGAVGLAGALCQYLGERCGLHAARGLLTATRANMAEHASHAHSDAILALSRQPTVTSMIQVVSRECALAAVQAARVPVALITTLGCFVFMFAWAPRATVVIAVAAPFYVWALSSLNRRAARIHEENTSLGDEARRDLAATLAPMECSNTSPAPQSSETAALARTDSIIFERIAVIRKVAFLNSATLTVLIVAILLLVRGAAFGDELDWATLIVFIVLLRFAATGMKQIAIATNVISRFFPSLNTALALWKCDGTTTPSVAVEPSAPSRVLGVLVERPNRITALRGAKLLEGNEPRVAPGLLQVRLDCAEGPVSYDQAVAHDARHVFNERLAPPDAGVLLVVGRSVEELAKLERTALVPELVADLRGGRARVVSWGDKRLTDAAANDATTEDPSDDLDLLDLE